VGLAVLTNMQVNGIGPQGYGSREHFPG
jgi:hypothetical protein